MLFLSLSGRCHAIITHLTDTVLIPCEQKVAFVCQIRLLSVHRKHFLDRQLEPEPLRTTQRMRSRRATTSVHNAQAYSPQEVKSRQKRTNGINSLTPIASVIKSITDLQFNRSYIDRSYIDGKEFAQNLLIDVATVLSNVNMSEQALNPSVGELVKTVTEILPGVLLPWLRATSKDVILISTDKIKMKLLK